MKNLTRLGAAALLNLLLLPLAGCSDDKTDDPSLPPPPAPVIEAAAPASIPAQGGMVTFPCTVKNPVEGKQLTAACAEKWVSELTVTSDAVTVRIEKSTVGQPRKAVIELAYEGAEAVEVTIEQEAYVPFEIAVADVTMNGVRITVYPEQAEGMYISAVDFAEGFDPSAIAAANKEIFVQHAEAQQTTLADFLAGYAYTGEQTYRPSRLTPATGYVAYAYGIDDAGNATTDVIVASFASLPVEPGPKVDCTISISTANLTSSTVDVTFTPSDPTVRYFYTMLDKAGYDDISKNWPGYIYEYIISKWRPDSTLTLEDIVGVCTVTGEWTSKGRDLLAETTYYACAVGVNAQAQINTDVAVLQIVTPKETPIDYSFDFAVTNLSASGATVTVTPRDVRAFYYWNVMTAAEYDELGRDEEKIAEWFEQMMDRRRIEQFGAYADMFYPLPDYIHDQCSKGDSGADTYTFGKLTPGTTYYPYAFWVDEKTSKIASATSFAQTPFTTPDRVTSAAKAEPAVWLTSGDDWARLDAAKYASCAGKAVLGARLTPNGDAAHWYSNIYNASDVARLTDEAWTSELTSKQYNSDKRSYTIALTPVEWGGQYVILSVAVDAAGNAGPLCKLPFTAAEGDAEPLESIPAE